MKAFDQKTLIPIINNLQECINNNDNEEILNILTKNVEI